MEFKKVRVHIGNLPPDISEDYIEKNLKKYSSVGSIELKHRQDGSAFAFANLEDSSENIEKCFRQATAKKWKGYQVTLQPAQESFLQRLQREREGQAAKPPQEHTREKNSRHSGELCNGSVDTKAKILQKFEAFSDVWKDTPSISSTEKLSLNQKEWRKPGSTSGIYERKMAEEKHEKWDNAIKNSVQNSYSNSRKRFREDNFSPLDKKNREGVDLKSHSGDVKKESENKRLKSIDERYKSYIQKKQTVKSALTNMDDSNRPNKKIVFDDDDNADIVTEESQKEKLVLFDEDEETGHAENAEDFKIRSQFEGKKGQKLLQLQARFNNDARFRLDERFYESDDEAPDETTQVSEEKGQAEEERYKMMQVLKDVIGDESIPKRKAKPKFNSMVRFDPSKPEHSKFEIKREERRKDLNVDIDEEIYGDKEKHMAEEKLPEVSKEKFYYVSDALKEGLKNKEKWSLFKTLGEEEREDDDDEAEPVREAKPIQKKVNWLVDPFKYDSSDAEEPSAASREEHLQSTQEVRRETFFFLKEDHRFTEGMQFIQDHKSLQPGIKEKLRKTIKHKIKLKQRDISMYARKFHGKRKRRT